MHKLVQLLLTSSAILSSFCLHAATFETVQNGNWDSPSTWAAGQAPAVDYASAWPGNRVIIRHAVSVNHSLTFAYQSGLEVASGGSLTVSGNISVPSGNAGQFVVAAGGTLAAQQWQAYSGNASYHIAGLLNVQTLDIKVASVILTGRCHANAVSADNGGQLTATQAYIQLTGGLYQAGGSSIALNNCQLHANNFLRPDGAFVANGGAFTLSNGLAASGGGQLIFNGTETDLGSSLVLSGGVSIRVRGRANLSAETISLQGGTSISGEDTGGILAAHNISIQGGAAIRCSYGNCQYGTGSLPIFPLDLATGLLSLPVSWLSVEAESTPRGVVVSWAVADESENDYFTVERSMDGRDWHDLGRVGGRGSATGRADYAFTDSNPVAGSFYYRVRQTDYDGVASWSAVVSITIEGALGAAFYIWPNPVPVGTVVRFSGHDVASVVLLGMDGKHKALTCRQGEIDIPANCAPGFYYLQAMGADGTKLIAPLVIQ